MEMLQQDFMQRAFYAGGIVALLASVLGVYLMLRRQALMADTLSHVSLAGVALGATLHWNPTVAGCMVAVLGAIAIEFLRRSYRSFSEMSLAIIMIGGLSTAVVLMSMTPSINKGFSAYLFGSVVAVSGTELLLMGSIAIISVVYFITMRKPLYTMTFDEETARTSGLQTNWLSFSFSVITGLVVAVAIPVVGVLLVSSLIILPAALAIRIATRFTDAILLSIVFGMFGVFSGLTTSYYYGTPPGGTIALTLLLLLGVGLLIRNVIRQVSQTRNRNRKQGIETTSTIL